MADGDFLGQLARLPDVQAAVHSRRDRIAAVADALFEPHDRPGGHSIETSEGAVDAYVSLVGPAPASVEFGHFTADGSQYVDGLFVMSKAARS